MLILTMMSQHITINIFELKETYGIIHYFWLSFLTSNKILISCAFWHKTTKFLRILSDYRLQKQSKTIHASQIRKKMNCRSLEDSNTINTTTKLRLLQPKWLKWFCIFFYFSQWMLANSEKTSQRGSPV